MAYAQQALQARLDGKHEEADRLFELAYQETSGGVDTAEVLFNWADNTRRLPEGEDRARAMLQEASDILYPIRHKYRKVYAAYKHHVARFLRNTDDVTSSLKAIESALVHIRRIESRNPLLWIAPYVDSLTIRLDTVSIRAINRHPWKARWVGLSALAWSLHPYLWMKRQVGPKHVVRALILLRWASDPFRNEPHVRHSFFDRS